MIEVLQREGMVSKGMRSGIGECNMTLINKYIVLLVEIVVVFVLVLLFLRFARNSLLRIRRFDIYMLLLFLPLLLVDFRPTSPKLDGCMRLSCRGYI